MRVVPKSQPTEDDNSQKLWIFSPSFIQMNGEEEEVEEKPPLLPPPPPPPLSGGKKRLREAGKKRKGERKKIKKEEDVMGEGSTSGGRAARGLLSSGERWTAERYERAELKVVDVMRAKAAELGNRIERKELREEARKHIGDTGLLDHLLKHMAGKVVGDRGERFMRGYNVEGTMQYWLEPAELEESRRNGELGDACHCGTECREEIRLLRERVEVLNRYINYITWNGKELILEIDRA